MAKIPFDIKFRPQIESGEYTVVCRDNNYPVTILLWDFKDPEGYNILAYYEDDKGQYPMMYNNKGELYHDEDNSFDLFIITSEPKLTRFEQALEVFLMNADASEQTFHEDVKKYAGELLDIARKELEPEFEKELDKAYKNRDEVVFREGVEKGKKEALQDLPKWKLSRAPRTNFPTIFYDCETGRGLLLYKDGYEISLDSLDKLPNSED